MVDIAAQYAPAPPTMTRSPTRGRGTQRGPSASGVAGRGREDVARLAARSNEDDLGALTASGQDDVDGVLRAIERRPCDFGHAGVELGEDIAVLARVHDIHAGRHDGACPCDEVRAGL